MKHWNMRMSRHKDVQNNLDWGSEILQQQQMFHFKLFWRITGHKDHKRTIMRKKREDFWISQSILNVICEGCKDRFGWWHPQKLNYPSLFIWLGKSSCKFTEEFDYTWPIIIKTNCALLTMPSRKQMHSCLRTDKLYPVSRHCGI